MHYQLSLIFLIFSWLPFYIPASEMILRDNFQKAQIGDYVVYLQNKNFTLLWIRNHKNDQLTIEEITVPCRKFPGTSWKQWIHQDGAPGHTSWIRSNFQVSTGQLLNSFSIPDQSWIDIRQTPPILSKLLNLSWTSIPTASRKCIGIAPSPGMNERPIWQPKLVVEGQTVPGTFSAWRTQWPADGSPLAERWIEIYLPESGTAPAAYFPFWLEVCGIASHKMTARVIDSGRGL